MDFLTGDECRRVSGLGKLTNRAFTKFRCPTVQVCFIHFVLFSLQYLSTLHSSLFTLTLLRSSFSLSKQRSNLVESRVAMYISSSAPNMMLEGR